MAENIYQNGTNTLMDELKVYDDQLQNYVTAIQALLQTVTQRGDNINKMLMNQATVFNYQLNNKLQAANILAQLVESQFNNSRNTYGDQTNILHSHFTNSVNSFTPKEALAKSFYNIYADYMNNKDRIYQEVLKNAYDAHNNEIDAMAKIFSTKADKILNTQQVLIQAIQGQRSWGELILNFQAQNWTHKIALLKYMLEVFQARSGAVSVWNDTWGEVFNRLATGIALDTAAQEGAQNPAIRLWNASVGLNQAATGVLVSMAGQGTKTRTAQQSGGDFFSGLFSAATTAFTSGVGSGLAGGLFSKSS